MPHNETYIVIADMRGNVTLCDAFNGRPLRSFIGHAGPVNSVLFSPDDRELFTAGNDKTTIQWEVATGRLLQRFTGHADAVEALSLSADGTRLVTAGDDKKAILWDVRSQKMLLFKVGSLFFYGPYVSRFGGILCLQERRELLLICAHMPTFSGVRECRCSAYIIVAYSPWRSCCCVRF